MKVRIRMYRQGLGDCFLLTFSTDSQKAHVLIDCGTLGATTTGVKMKDVAQNIAQETDQHIHLLIATHEHKDHLSGFRDQKALFETIQFDNVWLAWTENAEDPLAQQVKKYNKDLQTAMHLAANALRANQADDQKEREALAKTGSGIRELLSFYGDYDGEALGANFSETVNEAMNYVLSRAPGGKPLFLSPGTVLERDWLPGVRFYVLGPPRKPEQLKILGEHGHPELYEMAGSSAAGFAASAGLFQAPKSWSEYVSGLDLQEREELERAFPFDRRYRRDATNRQVRRQYYENYDDPSAAWRKIEYDWLGTAADFALQLDNMTNNTSLALAIELIEDGRVLLFPADAQVGNWMSWHDLKWKVKQPNGSMKEVTAEDLLRNTVLYKVGHHSSHNATMREHGLEMMKSRDLLALIPVDRQVALNKTPPWQMPAAALYERLLEKSTGRVLRSDTGWPADPDRPSSISKANWDQARTNANVTVNTLFIDALVE